MTSSPTKQNKQRKFKYNTVLWRYPKPHINISHTIAAALILRRTSNSKETLFFCSVFLALRSEQRRVLDVKAIEMCTTRHLINLHKPK